MVIIETPIFTRLVQELWDDDEYKNLQSALTLNPEIGDIIRGSGGLRKVRWGAKGRGKRGGARVIYYWRTAFGQIFMLYIFTKNKQTDLTPTQLKQLKKIIDEEYL